MLRITLFLSLALCLSGAQAEMYKWVDAEGNIQFSNQPPPKDTEAETLELEVPATLTPQDEAAPKDDAQAENPEVNQAPQGENENEGEKGAEGITPEQLKQKNCLAAQRNLKIFAGSGAEGLMLKGKDGKLYPVSKDEHKAKLEQAQKHVEQYCQPAAEETPAN